MLAALTEDRARTTIPVLIVSTDDPSRGSRALRVAAGFIASPSMSKTFFDRLRASLCHDGDVREQLMKRLSGCAAWKRGRPPRPERPARSTMEWADAVQATP